MSIVAGLLFLTYAFYVWAFATGWKPFVVVFNRAVIGMNDKVYGNRYEDNLRDELGVMYDEQEDDERRFES